MTKLIVTIVFAAVFSACAHAGKRPLEVWDLKNGKTISYEEFLHSIEPADYYIIGEKHYTKEVQEIEGEIAQTVITQNPNAFLGWEFLAHTQTTETLRLWSQVLNKQITVQEFLEKTQGSHNAHVYSPLLQPFANHQLSVVGLNLTRQEKSSVVSGGISKLSPELKPKLYNECSDQYRERFEGVMGGHTTPDKLKNYFDAQCLTDNVMAEQITQFRKPGAVAIAVAGSFHTDYFDGFVREVSRRDPVARIHSIRIWDNQDDWGVPMETLIRHSDYGAIADQVVVIGK